MNEPLSNVICKATGHEVLVTRLIIEPLKAEWMKPRAYSLYSFLMKNTEMITAADAVRATRVAMPAL